MSKARDGYRRIVVYQPRSGWVCDIGPNQMLQARFSADEDYFPTAAGTARAISRVRRFEIPVIDNDIAKRLDIMHKQGCEMRVIALGWSNHVIWEMDSEVNLVPFRRGARSFAGASLIFESNVFNCSVYQSEDLLGGIPWHCNDATLDGANYYFPGPSGYQGNRWLVSSGDAVDAGGAFSGSGTPSLTMHFPLEGAGLQLSGGWTGSLKTLDHSGATLATYSKGISDTIDLTIDDGTWKIVVTATIAGILPLVSITSPGAIVSPRTGVCVDCTNLSATAQSAPGWSS